MFFSSLIYLITKQNDFNEEEDSLAGFIYFVMSHV